jgi:thiamine-monophosphate kinase
MTLRELGEDRLVARITRDLPTNPLVRVGAGDDCAVLGRPRDARWQLLKTDAVLEGVHFLPGEDMARVGWKALCRTISDIAAMGGVPEHALITVALPSQWEVSQLDALYRGLGKAALQFGVSIVGGETSRSPGGLFVSVALTGWVERERCVLRSGGKAGDAVFVTGRLGGSLARKHLDFTPRFTEARWLTESFKLRSMMDLSDGVGTDLPRLAARSGCGYELWEHALPRTRGCTTRQALSDGEDFELLFTLRERDSGTLQERWRQHFPRLPLTQIGRLTKISPSEQSTPHGFDHFA